MFVAIVEWILLLDSEAWYLLGLEKSKPWSLQILLLPDSLVFFLLRPGWLWMLDFSTCPARLVNFSVFSVFSSSQALQSSFFWLKFLLTDFVHLFPSIELLLSVSFTVPELKFGSFLYFPGLLQNVSSPCSQWHIKHCYFKGPVRYPPSLDSFWVCFCYVSCGSQLHHPVL